MTHSALLAKVFILVNRTERVLKYASKTSLSPSSFFYFNRFKAVPLLQFFFVFASVVSYAALFFLSLLVPYLPFFWRLGTAVIRDCGIFCVSFIFFMTPYFCVHLSGTLEIINSIMTIISLLQWVGVYVTL